MAAKLLSATTDAAGRPKDDAEEDEGDAEPDLRQVPGEQAGEHQDHAEEGGDHAHDEPDAGSALVLHGHVADGCQRGHRAPFHAGNMAEKTVTPMPTPGR